MQRAEALEGGLVGAVEVVEVAAWVARAGRAVAVVLDRRGVADIAFVGQEEHAQPIALAGDGRADLPQPVSITDLACGLQPLSLPLVDLPRDVLYRAFDVHLGILATAEAFLQRWGQTHEVGSWDLLAGPPPGGHDLVLLLKTLPCLEQGRRGAGRALLAALEAQTVIVTYPLRSLGGRQVGMADHYRQQLAASVDGMPWRVEPLDLRGELGFRLRRA